MKRTPTDTATAETAFPAGETALGAGTGPEAGTEAGTDITLNEVRAVGGPGGGGGAGRGLEEVMVTTMATGGVAGGGVIVAEVERRLVGLLALEVLRRARKRTTL